MTKLLNWIDNRKKSTWVLVTILVLGYASVFFFSDVSWIGIFALITSVICPFAIFLIWVVDSMWVEKLLSRRWTAILIAGIVFVYGMFANTFAGDLINSYFEVDPSYFSVTGIFLTGIYLLVGVFQPFVMFPVQMAVLLLGGLFILFCLFFGRGKQALVRIIIFIPASILISASTSSLGLLNKNLPILMERIALASDFNEKNRCSVKWDVKVDKVVFLADGHVLAHIAGSHNYKILPCEAR